MNEISFRERWCASLKIFLTSDRDFEILWFLVLLVKIFFDNFEKFQQIWNFLVNEKWKNGLPDDILSKFGHFFISVIFSTVLRWLWKNGQFLIKCRQEGHFSTFHLPKSFKFVEIFPKLSKKILTKRAINHKISKSLSDVKKIFNQAHHRSRNEISFIFC